MLAAPTVGMAGATDKAYAEPLGTEDLIRSWRADSDPAVFDEYVSERIQDIREPRDEQRGPGPWNEFEG